METLSVRCNHCGAPLDIGMQTRFVTCQFCHSSLEIKRGASSVFTEEVTRIADNTAKMADSLEVIKLQNEIEQLDREWGARQNDARQAGGGTSPATPGAAMLGMGFFIFFALVCFGMASLASSNGAPGLFALGPVGMGIFALVAGAMGLSKARANTATAGDYPQRRAELTRKLGELNKE